MPRTSEFCTGIRLRGLLEEATFVDLKKSVNVFPGTIFSLTGYFAPGRVEVMVAGVMLTRSQTNNPGVIHRRNLEIPRLEFHSNKSLHSCDNICTSGLVHSGLNSRILCAGETTG